MIYEWHLRDGILHCVQPFAGLATLALLAGGCAGWPGLNHPSRNAASEEGAIVRVIEEWSFATPSEAWTLDDPSRWRIAREQERRFLQMAIPPENAPAEADTPWPRSCTFYNRFAFRSFSLAAYVRVDRPEDAAGRDVCIVFAEHAARAPGRRNGYYVQLSNLADPATTNIFRVDGDRRIPLVARIDKPAITDRQWHRVDLIRNVNTGVIDIFMDRTPGDADAEPFLHAVDRTYREGRIGFGSYDDHASFGRLAIEGQTPGANNRPADRSR